MIVTTPQDVALADALKGLKMFEEVKTPILGIVENMSGFVCPVCGTNHDIFDTGGGERIAKEHDVELLGKIPLEPLVRVGGDNGIPIVVANPDVRDRKGVRPGGRPGRNPPGRRCGQEAAQTDHHAEDGVTRNTIAGVNGVTQCVTPFACLLRSRI